jgi:hypothetical protein
MFKKLETCFCFYAALQLHLEGLAFIARDGVNLQMDALLCA